MLWVFYTYAAVHMRKRNAAKHGRGAHLNACSLNPQPVVTGVYACTHGWVLYTCAQEVRTGAQEVRTGAQEVRTGAQEVRTGAQEVRTGAQEVRTVRKRCALVRKRAQAVGICLLNVYVCICIGVCMCMHVYA